MDTITLENLLLVFPVFLLVGLPLYIKFREGMDREMEKEDYSRKRLFKLTTTNFLLNILVSAYFFVLLSLLLPYLSDFSLFAYVIFFFFFLSVCVTFYGNGIYIASIVIDEYTPPELKEEKLFDLQYLATNLYHGAISHALIYSGWPAAMLFLALLNLSGAVLPQGVNLWLMTAAGSVVGLLYAVAQIYNGTALYQFTTGFIFLIGFLLVLESGSVILQLFSKKLRHKKLFLAAPIHHHFEAKGWPAHQVTMRFWIIGVISAIIGIGIRLLG